MFLHGDHTKFVDEYTHFPKGLTDDILDAFAYTALLWLPGTDEETVVQSSQYDRDIEMARDSTTGY